MGKLLVAAVKRCEATSPDIAEAFAACYGLQVARRLGYSSIRVESDAANVVQATKEACNGVAPIHLIFDDIRDVSFCFGRFSSQLRILELLFSRVITLPDNLDNS
ncbi:hypothetical protein POM88_038834 [Heracleum sosnowskyi]|uniref:RNase H type-1 domain-containing protein n=1 Tax=Heracleum sosnowskyi TaxID=360622 RepID=A0AAD8M8R3_9APIA|nr:hypothetical protein POM88_038834 [Heracleum sosnowskyi]